MRRAGSSSTLRKTFLARHIDYAKRVSEKYTHNGPSDALKTLNQGVGRRSRLRRSRIEVGHERATYEMRITTATSRQHHQQPLHDPEDALGSRDLTPTAAQPRSPRLRRRRACRRDTPGRAQTWRPHRSGRDRYAISRHSLMVKKKRKRKKNKKRMKKDLPRGGMTIRVRTVATVRHRVVRRGLPMSTTPMKPLAVASATAAYATHLLYRDRDSHALQKRNPSTTTRSFGNVIRSDTT